MICVVKNITHHKPIPLTRTQGHLQENPPPEIKTLYGPHPVQQVSEGPQTDSTHEVISILYLYEVVDDRDAVARGEHWRGAIGEDGDVIVVREKVMRRTILKLQCQKLSNPTLISNHYTHP